VCAAGARVVVQEKQMAAEASREAALEAVRSRAAAFLARREVCARGLGVVGVRGAHGMSCTVLAKCAP